MWTSSSMLVLLITIVLWIPGDHQNIHSFRILVASLETCAGTISYSSKDNERYSLSGVIRGHTGDVVANSTCTCARQLFWCFFTTPLWVTQDSQNHSYTCHFSLSCGTRGLYVDIINFLTLGNILLNTFNDPFNKPLNWHLHMLCCLVSHLFGLGVGVLVIFTAEVQLAGYLLVGRLGSSEVMPKGTPGWIKAFKRKTVVCEKNCPSSCLLSLSLLQQQHVVC